MIIQFRCTWAETVFHYLPLLIVVKQLTFNCLESLKKPRKLAETQILRVSNAFCLIQIEILYLLLIFSEQFIFSKHGRQFTRNKEF